MRPNCEILMHFIMPCKRLRSKSAFNMRPQKVFGALKNEEGVEKHLTALLLRKPRLSDEGR